MRPGAGTCAVSAAICVCCFALWAQAVWAGEPADLYVDPLAGNDANPGTKTQPLRTVSAAVGLIPEVVRRPVTIHLGAGTYPSTGGKDMPEDCLLLRRTTWPYATIELVGEPGSGQQGEGARPVFDWRGGGPNSLLVLVQDGEWLLRNLQVGTRRKDQRQGIGVEGPGLLNLRDVRIRTRSLQGAGLLARRAGRIHLRGAIELNEDLHDRREDETHCRIWAQDHGTVMFTEREGASLSIGNGSLAAEYFGCVRLGCAWAKITSWDTSNNIAIGNSGRVDLHGTETILRGHHPDNTLIGPEDDGHIMAEDTHVILESLGSRHAIFLQKASTLFGGPFELRGEFEYAIVAMSGSVFAGTVKGPVKAVHAYTGAHVSMEHGSSVPEGPVHAESGATIVLPTDEVVR